MANPSLAQRALIRPQYHFRWIDGELHSWDVRKLAALVADLPVIEVPLADISEINEPYWFGEGGDVPTCKRVMEHAAQAVGVDLSYPILLCAEGRIMDGMHRVMKAFGLGHETIKAQRLPVTPPPHNIGKGPDELSYD